MTEMLLENNFMNINQEKTFMQNAIQNDTRRNDGFTSIYDSKLKNPPKTSTLGDVKKGSNEGDMSDRMSSFKKILKQAAGEIGVENSLNLTLSRDIGDIITQLKNAAISSINSDENIDEAAENSDFDYVSSILNEKENTEEEEEENLTQIIAAADTILQKDFEFSEIQTDTEEASNIEQQFAKLSPKEKAIEELQDSNDSVIDENMMNELKIESIESETTSNNGESFTDQTPQEHSMKIMLNQGGEKFDVNLIKQTEVLNSKVTDINPSKIIEQITKQMESSNGSSKVNIVLNPESLGRVDLQIINTKEGLSAQFTVTTNEARELIMKGLDGLKEALLAHGVGVDNISVRINETEECSYNQDWTEQEGSRGGNKEGGEPKKDEKEKGLFEETISKNLKDLNGNV